MLRRAKAQQLRSGSGPLLPCGDGTQPIGQLRIGGECAPPIAQARRTVAHDGVRKIRSDSRIQCRTYRCRRCALGPGRRDRRAWHGCGLCGLHRRRVGRGHHAAALGRGLRRLGRPGWQRCAGAACQQNWHEGEGQNLGNCAAVRCSANISGEKLQEHGAISRSKKGGERARGANGKRRRGRNGVSVHAVSCAQPQGACPSQASEYS